MKIVKASHEYMPHHNDPRRFIELVGRTCYKSTDKITDDSASKFVNNLINRNHWAMLEHETIYISCLPRDAKAFVESIYKTYSDPTYFRVTYESVPVGIISGSFRSFYELSKKIDILHTIPYVICYVLKRMYPWIPFEHVGESELSPANQLIADSIGVFSHDEFIRMCKASFPEVVLFPNDKYNISYNNILFKHLTHTVKFICDRGVSHELVRHRPCSFAQESTRYCNYSKDKFGQEITVVRPCFFEPYTMQYKIWEEACYNAENAYFDLIANGASPQEARDVLPNSLKTEIIVTATEQEWQHIVNLRAKGTTGKPHPQMVEIMEPCYKELITITDGRIS